MEDHFAAVLGQATSEGSGAPFVASPSFAGPKPGYTFGTGAKGTGYYLDTASSSGGGKRGRSAASSSDVDVGGPGKRAALAMAEADALDGAALLAAAEKRAAQGAGGEEAPAIEFDLDEAGLKQLALRFEKQITTNHRQRVKFADQPEKFLESVKLLSPINSAKCKRTCASYAFPSSGSLSSLGRLPLNLYVMYIHMPRKWPWTSKSSASMPWLLLLSFTLSWSNSAR